LATPTYNSDFARGQDVAQDRLHLVEVRRRGRRRIRIVSSVSTTACAARSAAPGSTPRSSDSLVRIASYADNASPVRPERQGPHELRSVPCPASTRLAALQQRPRSWPVHGWFRSPPSATATQAAARRAPGDRVRRRDSPGRPRALHRATMTAQRRGAGLRREGRLARRPVEPRGPAPGTRRHPRCRARLRAGRAFAKAYPGLLWKPVE
jgi:hypothetical protein